MILPGAVLQAGRVSAHTIHHRHGRGWYARVAVGVVTVLLAAVLAPVDFVSAQGNNRPEFDSSDYTLHMLPGTDGSNTVHTVGAVAAFDSDSGDTLVYGLRPSDPSDRMYMAGKGKDALYHVDSDDFTATRVDASVTAFGVGETAPTGITWHDGRLYMVGADTDALHTLDPDTGRGTRVNPGIVQFGVSENTPLSLASHRGDLYMLGDTTDALYRLDTGTGIAERVGYANQFGQNRNDPAALASFGSPAQLYALFSNTTTLYRLDIATGTAAGVSDNSTHDNSTHDNSTHDNSTHDNSSPQGMTVHNGRLYVVGSNPVRVWELLIADDAVTTVEVPTEAGFGVEENLPGGIATGYAQPPGYSISPSTGAISYTSGPTQQGVYTLYALVSDGKSTDGSADSAWDAAAAVTVEVANQSPSFGAGSYSYTLAPDSDGSGSPVAVGTPQATDLEGHTLTYSLRDSDPAERMYMNGLTANTLYTLDSTTGIAARAGPAQFGVSENWPSGMAWHHGRLYMVGGGNDSLYTVDTATGEAVLVATGAQITGNAKQTPLLNGVASHGGDLYVTTLNPGRLYRININTSTGTQIGIDDFGDADEGKPYGIASHAASPDSRAELYMIGSGADRLYTVDATTGETTPIGTGPGFGVGETLPSGLASHNGRLYMTGNTNKHLYEIDAATGEAVRVGNAVEFGVGESHGRGIATGYTRPTGFTIDTTTGEIAYTGGPAAAGVHTLYVQVSDGKAADNTASAETDGTARVVVTVPNRDPSFISSSYSYTLTSGSDGSSIPVTVGTPQAADPDGHTLVYTLRASDPSERMYMTGDANDSFYTLDSTTGVATLIAADGPFEGVFGNAHGLAWHNGQLYIVGRYNDSLYTLDIVTGETALVATGKQITGSDSRFHHLSGVASHDGDLYVTAANPGRLYRIDLDTLTGTQVGDDDFGAIEESYPWDIASHGSPAELYMIGDSTGRLYTINTDTGVGALVGTHHDFGIDEYYPLGLASHDGSLYMTGEDNNWLYRVNTADGTATRIGDTEDFDIGESRATGIASGYTLPAGFTIDAATGQIAYTGAAVSPGAHVLYVQVSDGKDPSNATDTTVDDTARVTISVPNLAPSFAEEAYDLNILPGADGSGTAEPVGTVTASDPEADAITYSLRDSDPADRMYMVGRTANALYTLDSTTSVASRVGNAVGFGIGITAVQGLTWHNGKLHLIGASTGAVAGTAANTPGTATESDGIFTVDTTTGVAVRVARLRDMGVGTETLTGIASHDGHLYVTSSGTGKLFRADLDARTVIQLGSDGFGDIDENTPTGLTSHAGKLYMVGTDTDKLYEIDSETGVGEAVGAATEFDAPGGGEDDPSGLASHGGSLYMVGDGQNRLYTLDTTTGAAARVSPDRTLVKSYLGVSVPILVEGTADFGVSEDSPAGLADGYDKPSVFAISSSTGAISYTGDAAVMGTEYTLYARVSDGRDSKGSGFSNVVDDTTTVTVTVVNRAPSFTASIYSYTMSSNGSTNDNGDNSSSVSVVLGSPSAVDPEGQSLIYSLRASDPSGRMYMLGGGADALYALNSTTGEASRVGSAERFGVSEDNPRGLAWHDGQLYMVGYSTDSLYTLDIATGEAVPVATGAQITGSGGAARRLSGVASHGGDLYATTVGTGGLYRVDLKTSTGVRIGVDGFGAVGEAEPVDIASYGSPARLYMIGNNTDRLYTLDTVTGVAVPVGTSGGFGAVGEIEPTGLTSHGGGLYMTGNTNGWLYSLSVTDGTAERVGDVYRFGVGESVARGIATGYVLPAGFAIDTSTGEIDYTRSSASADTMHILYAQVSDGAAADNTMSIAVDDTATVTVHVDQAPSFSAASYSYTLMPGNDGSSVPVVLGASPAMDTEGQTVTYSLRASDPLERMYMTGGKGGALYALNSSSSAAVRVGGADRFGVSETAPQGMTWHNGRLYMAGHSTNSLYTLDVATGEATLIATVAQITGSDDPDLKLSGVASHEGDLYVTAVGLAGRLYRLDLDTLAGTQVGADSFGSAISEAYPEDIASHGNPAELYMIGQSTDRLYTIDIESGAATRVGDATDFGNAETQPSGLASHGGNLYMTGYENNWLYIVDAESGAATRVGDATDFNADEQLGYGIASGYSQPSDFTVNAATGEIAYTGAAAEAGVHTLYMQVSDNSDSDSTADAAVDDIARVTITVPDLAPSFVQDSYEMSVLPDADRSSAAAPVGTVTAADPEGGAITYSLRASDPDGSMYMVGRTANALHTLDTATGIAARIGDADGFGIGITSAQGLAWHNGELHLIGATNTDSDGIFTVDAATGVAVRVARLRDLGGGVAVLTGITSHDGYLYLTAGGADKLFKADLDAGTAVQVGSDGFGSIGESSPTGVASHAGKLYMVGTDTDKLYEINTADGTATAVGTATEFNAPDGGENDPSGLASHNGNLYMSGNGQDRLYTLDINTGEASPIGTATSFGASESSPAGIAGSYDKPSEFTIAPSTGIISYTGSATAVGTQYTLYAQASDGRDSQGGGSSSVVDSTVPVTVRVENTAPVFSGRSYEFSLALDADGGFGPVAAGSVVAADTDTSDVLVYSLRPSDPSRMYIANTTADALYTLDSATGEAARVGAAVQFGVSETDPRGMAWHNGKLYMIGSDTDSLYTLDITTGEAALVATAAQITGSSGGAAFGGVASHDSELYVTTLTPGRLYRVDLDSLTGTQIGENDFGVNGGILPADIASHGSPVQLYMIDGSADKLYTLDAATGEATLVGIAANFGTADRIEPVAITSHADSLYMIGSVHNRLYTLNVVTGEAEIVDAATSETTHIDDATGEAATIDAAISETTHIDTATSEGVGESLVSGIATGYTPPIGFTIDAATGEISYTGTPSSSDAVYTLYAQVSDGKTEDNTANTTIDDTIQVTVQITVPTQNTTPTQSPPIPDTQLPHTPDTQQPPIPDTPPTPDTQQPPTPDTQPYLRDYFIDDDSSPTSPSVHEADINYIAAADITHGCDPTGTHYCPHDPVTRAQTASFLARALHLKPPLTPSIGAFLDITGNYHQDSIRSIVAANITRGCDPTDRYFCPNRPVSRAEMASFLTKAFNLTIPRNSTMGTFLDIAGNRYQNSIRAIAAANITRGCDPTGRYFCPNRLTTRAELASFLARALRR